MNEGLSWEDWPAARTPGKAGLVVLIVLATTLAITTVDRLLAGLGALLLVGAVGEWLLPTRFSVGSQGVQARSLLRRADRRWERLSGWRRIPGGFFLPGRTRSPLLRRLRGIELRCPGREAEVEALLRAHLKRIGD